MTSMPMRSHAASISRLIGWCALRSALNPASLSISTRRSSARGIVAAAEHAVVVVDARAAQFDGVAVDAQPAGRVDLDGADAERRSTHGRARRRRSGARCGTCTASGWSTLQRRGRVHEQPLPQRLGRAGEHRERRVVACDDRAGVVDDLGRDRRGRRDHRVVLHDRCHRDHRRRRRRPSGVVTCTPSSARCTGSPTTRWTFR